MDVIPQASLFIGIIPALILLYISLKGYDGHYQDKRIFLTFLFGLLIGFVSIIIEYYTSSIGELYIVLFPILEQLFKTIILNIGRFQGKGETTIYGLSLGLGFGSIFMPFQLILVSFNNEITNLMLFYTILGSFGFILLHGATGTIIGYGVSQRKLKKYFIFALLLHIPFAIISYISVIIDNNLIQLILIPYGLIIYWYATKKIMNLILIQTKRRKRST
jgi:hypothetical protein